MRATPQCDLWLTRRDGGRGALRSRRSRTTVNGLTSRRAAEVIVRAAGGREMRGSGYLVRARLLLTAEHVVRNAREVRVRFEANSGRE
jgi:S1-C subfamily serine protease